MQRAEFEEVLENQLAVVREMMVGKRDEYAGDEDVLHNFRNAANLTGETLEQALAGMMVKHTVSVYDMIATGEHFPLDKWNEKITDHLNYLILLRAIIEEKQKAWNQMVSDAEDDRPGGIIYVDASSAHPPMPGLSAVARQLSGLQQRGYRQP